MLTGILMGAVLFLMAALLATALYACSILWKMHMEASKKERTIAFHTANYARLGDSAADHLERALDAMLEKDKTA